MQNENKKPLQASVVKKDWAPQNNGGPLVKTGPTRGENRSRRKDGKWRKKRSDTGIPRQFHVFTGQPFNVQPDGSYSVS